ncbi:site-specific DNA-methyltransferase [Arcobacter cryaerophilus gv. pseudocryaerophilus]|uniref:site-specific DNA-methyltransferase (adenine-specific) n=2 Tax=Arcobacteraceae TaxID=2808963 RepID=A0AAU0P5V8_9BACT|nr:site-specific DNA-methyltransferase [Arcobacter sp. AZ-2023]WPD03211.1 site-specific DNA-methyltransferase [Arcobacter sp. DSM 115972]
MQNLDGKSMNIIEQNIEKLKEIFPEVFSEGKIDFSKLEEELGFFKEKSDERYNFTWNGKSEAKKIALTPSTGTLRPCKEESKDWDKTQNLYIEGDNLEVLKLLQKSYHKKVKMIYIDPPYNTGKDFVYKDNFRDNIKNYLEITGQVDSDGNKLSTNSETSGRYHSDWLNMMYPRLKLARNLLKDDGVIFISIDDNEVANLRKLCDEIFGEDNFIGNITVVGNPRGRDYGGIARMHDNILVYSKTNLYEMNNLLDNEKVFPFKDEIGEFEIRELRNRNIAFNSNNRPNLYYPFYINPLKQDTNGFFEISLDKKEDWIELYPKVSQGVNTVWRWGKPKSLENININIVGKAMVDGGWQIVEKYRERTVMARSVWWDKDVNTEKGTLLLKKIFDGKYFDFPKPMELISRVIEMGSDKNDLILDFFSGSATTAHAVMKLNSEDDGNRKFICVQLPEITDEKSESFKAGYKNICEIGKERIRRAGEKVKSESGKTELDIGFKVLKLDSSNIKSWDSDFENLETNLLDSVENIKSDRNEEDLLYEILLKYGLDLTLPINKPFENKNIYNIGFGALIICLDSNISIDITDEIIAIKKEYDSEITRVVFKDSGFKNATEKTNIIKTLNQNGIDEVVSV